MLEKEEIFEYDGNKYIVLCVVSKNDTEYYCVNLLEGEKEEVTDKFYIFKYQNGKNVMVTNQEEANLILPLIQVKIKEEIDNVLNGGNE